jgi:protease I
MKSARRDRATEDAMGKLEGCRVAALVTDGFEQVELTKPKKALEAEGAVVEVVAPKGGKVRGWDSRDWGNEVAVDCALADANAGDYDALLLPGGVMNPDKLRTDARAIAFIREFVKTQKPIAAICHGPWTLIDAGAVGARALTSWPSLKTDLRNAGAFWVDEEVVTDGPLVTSRKPSDIPAFCEAMIRVFAQGERRHPTDGKDSRAHRDAIR